MDLGLEGKRALVSGASRGIGLAVARRLAEEGVSVALCARHRPTLEAISAEINDLGGRTITVSGDLRKLSDIEKVVDQTTSALGGIDILVNSAGAAPRIDPFNGPDEAFLEAMSLKYLSYVRASRLVAKQMVERGNGRIVNVIGIGGVQPMAVHLPGGSANAALLLFNKGFGRLLAGHGVLMNAVNPGQVASERSTEHYRTKASFDGTSVEEARAAMLSNTPLGREAETDEIADLIAFLCSERCRYVAATSIDIDGGLIASI